MLFHPTYRFETCNSRKHFDSFQKVSHLVLLELYISERLKQVPEDWTSNDLLCMIKHTNRCRRKRSRGKIQTRAKETDAF